LNKKNLTNLFIVILAIASVIVAILNQRNNLAIFFALALSLLSQTKDDDYNQIYFSIAFFSSILLFGPFPIASLMTFEIARLFKKALEG
jgi:predicted membrane protein